MESLNMLNLTDDTNQFFHLSKYKILVKTFIQSWKPFNFFAFRTAAFKNNLKIAAVNKNSQKERLRKNS